MPIYSKPKSIFIRIPKTASSSIASSLHTNSIMRGGSNMYGKKIRQHTSALDIKNLIGEEGYDSFFKFAFVRNPWDRAVSFYFSYMNSGFKHRVSKKTDSANTMESIYKDALNNNSSNFESWLTNLSIAYDSGLNINRFDKKYISEYCPIGAPSSQLDFVRDEKKDIIVDYIGRYENIDSDWGEVCDALELGRPSLARFNSRGDDNHKKHYNKTLIAIISKIYKEEIDFFNYKYED